MSSKVVADKKYLFSTAIGTVYINQRLISDMDVEDLLQDNAISQARNLQFKQIGQEIDANGNVPDGALPSVFVNPGGDDTEEDI